MRNRDHREAPARVLHKAALGASLVAIAPATALVQTAPNDDDVIIVTAQRRQELSRDVPITVSSASAEQLQAANVQSLVSLSSWRPAGAWTSKVHTPSPISAA